MSTQWWALIGAGVLEIVWASMFKNAFKNDHVITAITIAAMIGSFELLWVAMRSIPVGTAYAVWTGIGAVGAATIGIVAFNEPATALRLGCIALILAGIIGLKVAA
ncbi:MAG: multidrug efflux SMR transporter [Hyphomonadaceae bacterium]|nr:multidrug efflux SMR transporter [Hyphomonadaceae bacterium]